MGACFLARRRASLLVDRDPEKASEWVFSSPSDEDLAHACAEVSDLVNMLVSSEDATEDEISSWEIVERQILNQIALRWMKGFDIAREAGWWVDSSVLLVPDAEAVA